MSVYRSVIGVVSVRIDGLTEHQAEALRSWLEYSRAQVKEMLSERARQPGSKLYLALITERQALDKAIEAMGSVGEWTGAR
jgi:hypothetical protein